MATKWGILGAGKICHDFVTSLTTFPAGQHEVVAVAARKQESAEEFAREHSIAKAFGVYKAVVMLPEVDVVYVGTINTQHLPLAKLAIDNGKHVLCEKPLCMNVKETEELVNHAKKKRVFLMEAVWSRFFPTYEELRKELDTGSVGDIYQVLVTFGEKIADVDRLTRKDLGGGTILDLGVYCVQFVNLIYKGEKPVKIVATGHLNEDGVDESMSATFVYGSGRMATINTHSKVELPCEGIVVGTKGTLKVGSPFWCPTHLVTPTKKLNFLLPPTTKSFNYTNSVGLRYEAEEVRRCLKEGLLESPRMPLKETLLNAEMMETMRKQLGVHYHQDK